MYCKLLKQKLINKLKVTVIAERSVFAKCAATAEELRLKLTRFDHTEYA